ncbi:S8 family serine peptidase [bacterium]|nr:S8 family serine peptidase [bacterium]
MLPISPRGSVRRLLALTAIVLLPTLAGAEAIDYVPNQLVCEVTGPAYLDSISLMYDVDSYLFLPDLNSYLMTAPMDANPESLAIAIAQKPYVVYCQANYILSAPEPVQGSQPFIDFDRTGTFEGQVAAEQVQLASTHAVATGDGVMVGVIDCGVSMTHPLLQGMAITGYDFISEDSIPDDEPGGSASGHGSFIAGVIKLVAPDADIAAYRVLDTAGRGDGFMIARAIVSAVDDGCKVINLSMVMSGVHETVNLAVEFARDHGVVVIAAAGNDSTEIARFPASSLHAISVAAVDSLNQKTDFSSFGSDVDVCAPGRNVYAPFGDSLFAWWDGTSFATPFVSGQAALLFAADPDASWDDIRDAIISTSVNIDSINTAYAGKLGAGLIQPLAALGAVLPPICGDFNSNLQGPDLSDLIAMVAYFFLSAAPPANPDVGNVNGDSDLDLSDLIYLANFLFLGGPPPQCTPLN